MSAVRLFHSIHRLVGGVSVEGGSERPLARSFQRILERTASEKETEENKEGSERFFHSRMQRLKKTVLVCLGSFLDHFFLFDPRSPRISFNYFLSQLRSADISSGFAHLL